MNSIFTLSTRSISRHRTFIYGFAAMWILLFHMLFEIPGGAAFAPLRWIKDSGNCGVDIFCLLSGMGLYYSFRRDEKILPFYGRRFSRVFLPAFIIIALNAALKGGAEAGIMNYLGRISVLGFWGGANVLWYAPFILAMYIIYPAIYHIQKKNAKLLWLVLAAALVFPVAAKIVLPGWANHVEKAISRIPAFIIGCMLAPALNEERTFSIKLSALILVPYVALQFVNYRILDRYSYIFLAAFMIIFLTKAAEFIASKNYLHVIYRITAFMGGVSFELYLLQQRVADWMHTKGNLWQEWNAMKLDMVTLIFTIILAVVLQKLCQLLTAQFKKTNIPTE